MHASVFVIRNSNLLLTLQYLTMVTLSATGFSHLPVADSGYLVSNLPVVVSSDLVSNLPVADSGDLLSNLPVADSGDLVSNLPVAGSGDLVSVVCWSVIDNFGFLFK